MKTFTLRLTEIEAEALERLSYSNGISKNEQIKRLISSSYGNLDAFSVLISSEDKLIEISALPSFVDGVLESFYADKTHTDADILRVLRSADYALENKENEDLTEEELKRIEEIRQDFIECHIR